ncbi:MAG: hypothetical protein RBT75_00215 [Anaerolineae bacterium]|nr:hypothetical protein [Anaerolineae bacterium]
MTDKHETPNQPDLDSILESAARLGMQINADEARRWLDAIQTMKGDDDITMDVKTGVFGHKISMLDFSPAELARFREIGKLVEFHDVPGVVETALALSGSAAQSKIQTHPGDCDYFERVNIIAPTREEACRILGEIMREKALSTLRGGTYQLIEVKFGSYPFEIVKEGTPLRAGSPIAWTANEVEAGGIVAELPDGTPVTLTWEQAAQDPGWCKLDWVVADPIHQRLSNASNMLDVTWEAPDGAIIPLDGYLDAYFQEIYLEAESAPIFSKLVKHVSPDVLADYVAAMEKQVQQYLRYTPQNYGKAAKRMYNLFRLTGRYQEAAFLREIFDEPTTILYQVWSLIRTIDDAFQPGATIPLDNLLAETDHLIVAVIEALEGEKETEIVRYLLRLRDLLSRQQVGKTLNEQAEAARAEVINIVNNFFYDKMAGLPTIKAYMDEVQKPA